MKKATLIFKASENDQNRKITCTEVVGVILHVIKNNPDYLGATFVAIALITFIDGVKTIFDYMKVQREMAFFLIYF